MTSSLSRALLLAALVLPGAALAEPHVNVIGLIGERAILRVDGQQVILRPGEVSGEVGLVRVENGEAVLHVGKREVRMGMGMDTGGYAPREAGGTVQIPMNGSGQFITSGRINGRMVEFLVDTGANTVSMTSEEARRLGIDYRNGLPASSTTAGGVVAAWAVTLPSVQVGPIEVKNVLATVREAPTLSPILLGMTFLSRIELAQEGQRLRLTAR